MFEELTKQMQGIRAAFETKRAALRAQIGALDAVIGRAERAPAPIGEADARARAIVKRFGDIWLQENTFQFLARNGLLGHTFVPHLPSENQIDIPLHVMTGFGFMCATEPDRATAILKALDRAVTVERGPADADRPAILADARQQRAELAKNEEALVDEAIGFGFAVEHRPDVTERRIKEQRDVVFQADRDAVEDHISRNRVRQYRRVDERGNVTLANGQVPDVAVPPTATAEPVTGEVASETPAS